MTRGVVILNDTRSDLHHGCTRVMDILEAGLTARGASILATSPVRHRWFQDAALLSAMARADTIVVNGEGTIHSGRRGGADLLRVAVHPLAAGRRVYLVNALYEGNPESWDDMVAAFDGIWTRDSASAAVLRRVTTEVETLPDLTLCAGPLPVRGTRRGIVWGDSVSAPVASTLADLGTLRGEPVVPSVSRLKRPKGRTAVTRALRNAYVAALKVRAARRWPTLALAPDPAAYARAIGSADLHVTGRFHGVCYSILTGTPFVAVASTTRKIETLLADVGLDPARVVPVDGLERALDARDWGWSQDERRAIDATLLQGAAGAEAMFDRIVGA